MPSYNILCTNEQCHMSIETKEIRKKMLDPFPKCEECGSETKNVMIPTPFSTKGSGWFGKSKGN
jgi:predicted nucleic acid-binding Zn ribbon protein